MIINEVRLNQHQSHLESLVMFGKKGLEEINYKVENFINRFKDNNDNLNITTKIDGSPSLFMWSHVDGYPDNSIALKGFVNGPQTAMSSEEEIDEKYGDRPDMADKLKQGLKLAKYIPSGEAWQGDCLFTQSTLEEREINGKNYLTFQPNKIIYAFSEDNPGYNRVKSADFGIAFHTIYRVNNGKLSQSFRVNTERLNAPDNFYLLSPAINQNLDKDSFDLSHIENLYNKLKEVENKLVNDKAYEELINNKQFINYWNMFENKMLADNKATNINVNTLIDDLTSYVEEKSNKELDRKLNVLKTDDAKERARNAQASNLEQLNNLINSNKDTLKNIVDALNITSDIKMLMLKGFKQVKQDYSTFYKSKTKGYFTADPEGIAMSDDDGNIVKLVDRSAFSSYNRDSDIESGWERNESFGVATQGADMGSFKSFTKNLDEDNSKKVAVVAFGRFNPPSIGHRKLAKKMSSLANGEKPKIYMSHKVNSTSDPLSYDSKIRWARKEFGDLADIVESDARNAFEALNELYNQGYTDIIYVGGEDRVGGENDYSQQIINYNGKTDKNGNLVYKFNSITPENAGVRNVNSVDIEEQASSSLLRKLVLENNFDEFKKYVYLNDSDAYNLFRELKHAMKGKEESFLEACSRRIKSLIKANKKIVEASLLTKKKLEKNPEMIADLESELDKIDKKLNVPDLDKGLDDYRINQKDYQGIFVKQGNKDVVSFSPKDVAAYAENELHKDGDKVSNALDSISIEDSRGNEFDLYKSKSTLFNAKGGATWNDKVEITYYQECIQLLLLTNYINYPGEFNEWLLNSDRNKETGIFEYIYPFNKSKVKDESLFKQYWAGFVKSYSKTFDLCISNSSAFISEINGILKTSGGLIPIHGGIRSSYSDLAAEILAGNDVIDKSDGYVVSKKDKSKITKILDTMISLKGDAVNYVKYMESAPIVGVSLKKSEKSISFDYNEQPIKPSDVKELMFKTSASGSKIIFNLDGEEVSLDLRSAGDVKKIEFRPKGKAAYGNAVEALKRVLKDDYAKLGKFMKSSEFRKAAQYLIFLLCGEKSPKEDRVYKMTSSGMKMFSKIFNFAAGRPAYDSKGNRLTAPYMKVH